MTSCALVEADVRHWLESAVIGLNLCPFAKAVHIKRQIRYAISAAADSATLFEDLRLEMHLLHAADPAALDTTLLVAPGCLGDFLQFNDFLAKAEDLLEQLGLDGTLQIASFHPQYQFGGTEPDDITNYTNRAPYPILHLLREDSVERAIESFPDAESIYGNNMRTLERIGRAGWDALQIGPRHGDLT